MSIRKLKEWFYDLKWGIKNLILYHSIVKKMRPWDYNYIIEMQKFQLLILRENIKNGPEIEKDKNIKLKDIDRCLEIMNNILSGNYHERVGYHSGDKEWGEIRKLIVKSTILESSEYIELHDILGKKSRGWWT